MKGKLRFTVSALLWAMLLLAAYKAPAAQTQTEATGNYHPARNDRTMTQEPADITATGPISLHDVGEPFQTVLAETPPANQFKVPGGKRLVIEYVSGRIPVGLGQQLESLNLLTEVNNAQAFHYFTPILTSRVTQSIFTVTQQTRIYADPGTVVIMFTQGAAVTATARLTISGYLVDVQ